MVVIFRTFELFELLTTCNVVAGDEVPIPTFPEPSFKTKFCPPSSQSL